jgi:hypothetical protein
VPKILGVPGPYSFFFYSFDCNEPMHVHVRRDNRPSFGWHPLLWSGIMGSAPGELNDIRRIVVEQEPLIIEAWHEHCG